MSEDFSNMSAVELVSGYREERFSPVDAVAASLDRAEALQDRFNAFVLIDRDGALADAQAAAPIPLPGDPAGAQTLSR